MKALRRGGYAGFCLCLFMLVSFVAEAWAGDAAHFVGETYPDNSSVAGGTSFTKTWSITNVGTTTWTSSYKLKYVSGSLSTSQADIAISGTVAPGASYTFSVPMKTPAAQSSDKTYREDWKFTNPSGSTINVDYSPTVWALIKVPAAAAGTDSASFTGENYPDNSVVAGGTSFTKTWTIKNTGTTTWTSSYKLKYVSGGGLSVSQADIAISATVAPGASYTFSVPMKAPAAQSSEKTYRDDWKFYNPSGASIIPLWAVIKVPAAPAAGTDAASFVSETYPDNSSVTGGTSFTKTWTIKNTGTNTWTSSYKLKYVSGGLSTSQADIAISGTVAPGASYTFSVPMKAPAAQSSDKTYREDWKFTNPSGSTINIDSTATIWALIKVPAASAPSDDHGNTVSTATPVNLNSSKAGVINYGGDWDVFRIAMASPGLLTVHTTGSTDTYGYLKNSIGEDIKSNDDQSSSNKNFLMSVRMPSGTYYVAVRHYNSTGTGSYTFHADFTPNGKTDDHGNRCAEATSVSSNSNTFGMINYAGDVDYFRISVPYQGMLTISTLGALDSYGRLFDSSCTEIAHDNDAGIAYNFRIAKPVSAGTYYVEVRHDKSTKTGAYVMRTSLSPAPAVPVLISPSNGKDDVSGATFRWNKSTSATSYRIVVSQNSSFSGFDENTLKCDGTCFTAKTSSTKYVKSSFALSGHTYYWHVRANGSGGASGWSSSWQFTTAGIAGHEFPAVNWDSLAYRNNNIFWIAGYAPKRFYLNNISPNLGDAKGNCTWYAHGRLKELGYNAKKLNLMSGNAAKWKSQAVSGGISVSQVPMQGDIAQATANYGIYTKYGHVAVVEKVNSDGTLLISESSYAPNSKTWNFEYRTRTVSRSEFNNYIHVPKP